jgi:hypothetical protein
LCFFELQEINQCLEPDITASSSEKRPSSYAWTCSPRRYPWGTGVTRYKRLKLNELRRVVGMLSPPTSLVPPGLSSWAPPPLSGRLRSARKPYRPCARLNQRSRGRYALEFPTQSVCACGLDLLGKFGPRQPCATGLPYRKPITGKPFGPKGAVKKLKTAPLGAVFNKESLINRYILDE